MKIACISIEKLNIKKQQGVLLVESMVAIAVFSIAILGLSALQLTSSKSNLRSLVRTEAAVASSEIIDLMRANRQGVSSGNYNYSLNDTEFPDGQNQPQAELDINRLLRNLKNNVATNFSPKASISCVDLDCVITIQWNDSRAEETEETNGTPDLFIYQTNINL